jgi:site-specific DNA-cytosine methylase
MNVFVDLFSGLGGAAQAFDEHYEWMTIKIDANPELVPLNRGLIIHDIEDIPGTIEIIQTMMDASIEHIEKLVIWASPPCQQFSYANIYRDPTDFDLTLFDAAVQIINHFKPNHWFLENVQGAKETFTDELDRAPRQEIGSIVLWGDFPLLSIRNRDSFEHKKMNAKGSRSLRPNYRALIPEAVSQAVLDAVHRQTTLW